MGLLRGEYGVYYACGPGNLYTRIMPIVKEAIAKNFTGNIKLPEEREHAQRDRHSEILITVFNPINLDIENFLADEGAEIIVETTTTSRVGSGSNIIKGIESNIATFPLTEKSFKYIVITTAIANGLKKSKIKLRSGEKELCFSLQYKPYIPNSSWRDPIIKEIVWTPSSDEPVI